MKLIAIVSVLLSTTIPAVAFANDIPMSGSVSLSKEFKSDCTVPEPTVGHFSDGAIRMDWQGMCPQGGSWFTLSTSDSHASNESYVSTVLHQNDPSTTLLKGGVKMYGSTLTAYKIVDRTDAVNKRAGKQERRKSVYYTVSWISDSRISDFTCHAETEPDESLDASFLDSAQKFREGYCERMVRTLIIK
jgi:hypothetical protein